MSDTNSPTIGYIVGGGLQANLQVRLTVPADQLQEGGFVVIESGDWVYCGLVTDLMLGATNPRFADEQSEQRLPESLAQLLHGQTLFTNLVVLPALMMARIPDIGTPEYEPWRKAHPDDSELQPLPVKTVPAHHAPVRRAQEEDVSRIFGGPDKPSSFVIGKTREGDLPIRIDLAKFVQRSAGIFGATGTGKSFLTRIILAGLIKYDAASVLVFDMHNEYGLDDIASDTSKPVTGLKSKFGSKVQVVALGSGSQIRGKTPDAHLTIAYSDISTVDIEMLTRELNLKETTATTLDALYQSFHQDWFQSFMTMDLGTTVEDEATGKKVPAPGSVEHWAMTNGVNVMAAQGLYSKLRRVFDKPYLVPQCPAGSSLDVILQYLERKSHVVLSFGKYESDLDYLLVTNILTRRIREKWEGMVNAFRSQGEKEPRPLVIAVEEAHKILNREMASQTTFSTIAREMRKYYVTLLIIDQRPSQIDDEVMSQLGTRISGWLGDDSDIAAVLSGLAGKDALRGMLSRLQPKEEVLALGWGVPMPILVRSRRYDDVFWKELLGDGGKDSGSKGDWGERLGMG
jgi:hypothetical protein